jgi:hypothetical protein
MPSDRVKFVRVGVGVVGDAPSHVQRSSSPPSVEGLLSPSEVTFKKKQFRGFYAPGPAVSNSAVKRTTGVLRLSVKHETSSRSRRYVPFVPLSHMDLQGRLRGGSCACAIEVSPTLG